MRAATRTAAVLARPGATAIGAFSRTRGLTLVGWHRVARDGDGLSTSYDDFRRQLDTLAQWQATVLPLREAARLLAVDQLPERAVALTFDDGYASVVDLAWPELQARGLPAVLFAVSGYLDGTSRFPWDRHHPESETVRIADRAALREAAAAELEIGSHTVNHRWLPHLSPAEVDAELRDSRAELEDLVGAEVRTFAYPMGGWSQSVRARVARAGYHVAVTVDRGRSRLGQDPLALRRAFAFNRADDFLMQLEGAYSWMRPIERWRTRSGPRW